jgi:hypothetical protein
MCRLDIFHSAKIVKKSKIANEELIFLHSHPKTLLRIYRIPLFRTYIASIVFWIRLSKIDYQLFNRVYEYCHKTLSNRRGKGEVIQKIYS